MSKSISNRVVLPAVILAGAITALPLQAGAKSVKPTTIGVLEQKEAKYSKEEQAAYRKLQVATGGRVAKDAKLRLKYRIYDAKMRIDTIEEAIAKVEKQQSKMAAKKRRHDDRSVFSPFDPDDDDKEKASKIGKKVTKKSLTGAGRRYLDAKAVERAAKGLTGAAADRAAKEGLKRSAGRLVGWIGWLAEGAEIGAKKWIKEDVSDTLAEYIRQHRATVTGLTKLIIKIRTQINKDLAKLDEIERLEKIYRAAADRAAEAALAVLRAKRAAEPATRRAVLDREFDREGDREEERKYKRKIRRDAAKRARIEVVPEDRPRRTRRRKRIPTIKMRGSRRHKSRRTQRRTEPLARTGLSIEFGFGGMGGMRRRHHRGLGVHRARRKALRRSHRPVRERGRRGEW